MLGVTGALLFILRVLTLMPRGNGLRRRLSLRRKLAEAVAAEVEERVTRLPAGIVSFATRRLPEPRRSDLRRELLAELAQIAEETAHYPVTSYVRRLRRSLGFSLDLVRAGGAWTRDLNGSPETPAPAGMRGHADGHSTALGVLGYDQEAHERIAEIENGRAG